MKFILFAVCVALIATSVTSFSLSNIFNSVNQNPNLNQLSNAIASLQNLASLLSDVKPLLSNAGTQDITTFISNLKSLADSKNPQFGTALANIQNLLSKLGGLQNQGKIPALINTLKTIASSNPASIKQLIDQLQALQPNGK